VPSDEQSVQMADVGREQLPSSVEEPRDAAPNAMDASSAASFVAPADLSDPSAPVPTSAAPDEDSEPIAKRTRRRSNRVKLFAHAGQAVGFSLPAPPRVQRESPCSPYQSDSKFEGGKADTESELTDSDVDSEQRRTPAPNNTATPPPSCCSKSPAVSSAAAPIAEPAAGPPPASSFSLSHEVDSGGAKRALAEEARGAAPSAIDVASRLFNTQQLGAAVLEARQRLAQRSAQAVAEEEVEEKEQPIQVRGVAPDPLMPAQIVIDAAPPSQAVAMDCSADSRGAAAAASSSAAAAEQAMEIGTRTPMLFNRRIRLPTLNSSAVRLALILI
jgi:hypothetical protein